MIKGWIRKWLGVDDDIKITASRIIDISKELNDKIEHSNSNIRFLLSYGNGCSQLTQIDRMFYDRIIALADHVGIEFKTIQVPDPCAMPHHVPTIYRVVCVKKAKK